MNDTAGSVAVTGGSAGADVTGRSWPSEAVGYCWEARAGGRHVTCARDSGMAFRTHTGPREWGEPLPRRLVLRGLVDRSSASQGHAGAQMVHDRGPDGWGCAVFHVLIRDGDAEELKNRGWLLVATRLAARGTRLLHIAPTRL